MDHSKRKNIYIIVFVVTTIIAACVAVYFGIKENERKGDLQIANKDIEEYKSKLEEASKGEVTTPNTDRKDCEEKVVEKIVEKRMFASYDSTKFKKGGNSALKDVRVFLTYPFSRAVIYENGSVTVWYIPGEDMNLIKEINVTGLKGKVKDVIAGPIGDGASAAMFFLMEDGTVEWSNDIYDTVRSGKFYSKGKIEGVTDIVRLCFVENNKAGMPVAIDSQGNCYDLTY